MKTMNDPRRHLSPLDHALDVVRRALNPRVASARAEFESAQSELVRLEGVAHRYAELVAAVEEARRRFEIGQSILDQSTAAARTEEIVHSIGSGAAAGQDITSHGAELAALDALVRHRDAALAAARAVTVEAAVAALEAFRCERVDDLRQLGLAPAA